MVSCFVYFLYELALDGIHLIKIVYSNISTRSLVGLPSVKFDSCIQISKAHDIVILVQISLIYTSYCKATYTHTIIINEIGKYTLA